MRRDRWISLYELGKLLQKNDKRLERLSRRSLRQHAHRVVKQAEEFGCEKYTKLWKGRLYVSVGALDSILPLDDQVISRVERNQADQASKLREMQRQLGSHGSRIRNLEKWRELTEKYIAAVAELGGPENDSKVPQRSARV